MITSHESPFVCDLNAIKPVDRDRHIAAVIEVFQAVQSIRELPTGYAFRLPNDTSLLIKSAEFISNERLCCPFFGFAVVVEPQDGPLWLHLTGPEGVKPFIQAEIGEALNDEAARAAGFR
jgi:uncharacterized Fe-S cluster-containing protein